MYEISENVVKSFAYLSLIIELSKGRKITGYDVLVHLQEFGLEVSPACALPLLNSFYSIKMSEK